MKDLFELNVKSLMALYELFPTEEACIKHLENIYWQGNPLSPFDRTSKIYKLKNGQYRCKNTGRYFNIRIKTMFVQTRVSLHKWVVDIWFVVNHIKLACLPINLLAIYGVTQKTA